MPSKYEEEKERVECAVGAARAVVKLDFSALAREWKVDRLHISRRYQVKNSKLTRAPTNRKLDDDQERALLQYIGISDGLDLSARPELVIAPATQLLSVAHVGSGPPPVVGANWLPNFIKRHEVLLKVKQKSRELTRMTQDRTTLAKLFKKLKTTVDREEIFACDMWNVDDVGFRVGIGGKQRIITLNPTREAHLASETCRDFMTCIETVSALGQHIDPMVIMSASQHSESWVNNDLPDTTLLAVSPNGYTDDILALKWIKHFDARTKGMTKGNKCLLIFDGHGSHCTKQFIDYCNKANIIPFSLPPHSSHILQPLNVSVFQPMKHWHRVAIDAATQTECTNFNKIEFLASLNDIRVKTMKTNTIKNGFRLVLVNFPEQTQIPSVISPTSPSTQSPDAPTTPKTVRTLSRVVNDIEQRYGDEISPTVLKCVRGGLLQAQVGSLAVSAMRHQTAAQKERNKRTERQRKVTQSGGVLYAEDAREIAEEKMEKEEKEEERRIWVKVKTEVKKRKAEGWQKEYVQMRKEVKRRCKMAMLELPEEEEEELFEEDVFPPAC
ncbi:hypothetical protein A4X09_0g6984 [Tilletia walkeri]|uniref:HTH CENPB-type domain-containing protein n=1 Tax=Tilletia walkeri TaxID=117179 RepID=A0A8X7T1U9_9BASI|nr:hypothetical protein A4X09_0g6984 [Tilletia walkeri]